MSLRDYLAARAPTSPPWFEPFEDDGVRLVNITPEQRLDREARWAWKWADALLKRRASP